MSEYHHCPACNHSGPPAAMAEPPLGTWVKDRHGAAHQRRIDADGRDGWGQPGFYSTGRWEAMWEARGPLVICGPWGADLDAAAEATR